jgi:undecaprenyl phosphate N,N'-diacetylbacillosamine 1-phosphate transferase
VEVEERVHTEPSLAPSARQQVKGGFYRRYGKRLMDIVLSLCALVLLSPLMLVVALLVRIKLGSPVIFRQERPGLNEKIFTLYKFRTMTDERGPDGKLLPDAVRLTRFGRWLRSTSLDELPELVNILKGDMSVVGPRPLLVQYLPLYSEHQRRRHEVRPGLTGLAQISGRNSISWEEKFDLDVRYVDSMSFLEDCRVILETVKCVVARNGISQEGEATMEAFRGSGRGTAR